MTKGKLDKQLAGQSSTLHMPSKTHPYEKHTAINFDVYKSLAKQIDRLGEVMEKIIQDLKVDKFSKTDLIILTLIDADAVEIIPAIIVDMAEAEETFWQSHMIGTEEGFFYSEADPVLTIIEEGWIEDKTIIEI